MRLAPAAWVQLAAAAVALLGAAGAWGALSLVAEQAAVVRSTRWILAGLVVGAGALAWPGARWTHGVAAALFLAAGVLGWTEFRYEDIQATYYGVEGPAWGFWALFAGVAVGVAASLMRLREPRARSPSP